MLLTSNVEYHKDLSLGPLLFLLYVNDMSQSVDCKLFFYAGDACVVY